MKRVNKNERRGVISMIIISLLAIGGVYYFFSPKSFHYVTEDGNAINVPVEVPAPNPDE